MRFNGGTFVDFMDSKLAAMGTAVAAVSGIIYGGWWYKNYINNKPPSDWVQVAEISELYIYPMKSFKPLKPESFQCTPFGPMLGSLRDRSFAVLNDFGKVVSGRNYPKMCQIAATFNGPEIMLSFPDFPSEVRFSLDDDLGESKSFKVYNSDIEGRDCGDKVAKWLSNVLLDEDSGLRLYYCSNQDRGKAVNPIISNVAALMKSHTNENDGGFYSDAVSYHLISDTSTAYLNTRSNGETIYSLNFRPNFVVKGEKLIPFEEDQWNWIKIGDTIFRNISPCTRCLFTTVDPATGKRSDKLEPLTSLKRYRNLRDPRKRKVMPDPAMGIYMGVRVPGEIRMGDPVYVPAY